MRIPVVRLDRQCVSRPLDASPADVVGWFGAMQSQDYLAALWALGLRTAGATEAAIESALAEGSVLRTHIFRGTWQYVRREDVRWMLDLVGARVIAGAAGRFRELGLDERFLKRCAELFARALEGGAHLTRREMADVLARGRIKDTEGRLMHILGHTELSGIIASGARRGKQPTFALLDHRAPKAARLDREASLCELAIRYFRSRGPATIRDFTWWTGLPIRDARLAIELARPSLESGVIDGESWWSIPGHRTARRRAGAYLLPAFDEYLIAYADRSAMLDPKFLRRVNAGGGLLRPAVVIDGQVVGTWTRVLGKGTVSVTLEPFSSFDARERDALRGAALRYAGFLGLRLAGR